MKTVWNAVVLYIKNIDKALPAACVAAWAFGMLLIASAGGSYKIQAAGFALGFAAMIIVSAIDYSLYVKYYKIIVLLSLLGLCSIFVLGSRSTDSAGVETLFGNNYNWIRLGPVNVQPSEIVKIGFIIGIAAYFSRIGERINSVLGFLGAMLIFGLFMGILALQGDLGTMLVYIFVFVIMLFCAGFKIRYFLIGSALAVPLMPVVWFRILKTYQRERILVGFNPERDPLGYGWQVIQGKIAIGGGGILGQGLFSGAQTQRHIIPAQHTDFIFTVAGEETGLIGSLFLIALLCFIVYRVARSAYRANDAAGRLMCMGVFAMLLFQTAENIAMCLGVMPVVGITLPFFSYGGSSIISVMCCVGLCINVGLRAKIKRKSIFDF